MYFLKLGKMSFYMYAFLASKALALVRNDPINKAGNGNGIAASPYHFYKEVLQLPTINVVEQVLQALRAKEFVEGPRVEAAICCMPRYQASISP